MELAYRSEQGPSPRNEDSCLALKEEGLFLVCDGLSVKAGGDVAARLAGEAFTAWYASVKGAVERARTSGSKEERRAVEDLLAEGFQNASRAIFQHAATDPAFHGMCTSVDLLLLLGAHALVGHVGAGRVYLVRKGEGHLLTEDHTQLAHLRRIGKIDGATPQQMATYSRRLTRAVGFQEEVRADILLIELEPGDRFVLVTDGVWQPLGEGTTFSLVARPGPAKEVLKQLHATVEETGAKDNYSTLIVDPQLAPISVQAGAEQKIKMLGKVPAFEYLSYQELLKVLSAGDLVKVAQGQVLCKEGDEGGEMMLVISGSANVIKNGKVIRTLGKGEVFGEMSMIDAAPRSASVVAAAATNLLAFPRESLFNLFREDPALSVKFLWGVTMEMNKRLRMASNKLVGRPESEGLAVTKNGPLPFVRSL